ncbi:hypothetical protein ACN28C_17495 [Plantactinospora sp. WMMC1484]|uniref:hypothetical protein n=1 Tax=Plantactinospora sp. WMMC1484 TaxID=3404122 RepID=UPI003BF4B93E
MPKRTLSRRLFAGALGLATMLALQPGEARAAAPADLPTYTYLDLGPLGTTPGGRAFSEAAAVNAAGTAAGLATTSLRGYSLRATTWTGGVVRDLGAISTTAYSSSQATDINDLGVVVGASHVNATDPMHAFVHRHGVMSDLGTGYGPGSGSVAQGINEAGVVVGWRYEAQGAPYRGVVWRDGEIVEIGSFGGTAGPWGTLSVANAVNDHGQVVGAAATPDGPLHGFVWMDGVLRDLGTLGGNGESTVAHDINDRGEVVGMSPTADGEMRAFLWRDGDMRDLGALGRDLSVAYGVNGVGQVVGTLQSAADFRNDHAFLWQDGTMVDLNERVPELPASVTLQSAQDINDSGMIVGFACPIPCDLGGDEVRRGFLLTPTD